MKDVKVFNIRLDRSLWKFLKDQSVEREMSMNAIIGEYVKKYKNKVEKKIEKQLTASL